MVVKGRQGCRGTGLDAGADRARRAPEVRRLRRSVVAPDIAVWRMGRTGGASDLR